MLTENIESRYYERERESEKNEVANLKGRAICKYDGDDEHGDVDQIVRRQEQQKMLGGEKI